MGVRYMKVLNINAGLNSLDDLTLSHAQQNYLIQGSYGFKSINGQKLIRMLQIIGIDKISGDLLILEKCSDDYPFRKLFILSTEGETKKYKGQSFLQVS